MSVVEKNVPPGFSPTAMNQPPHIPILSAPYQGPPPTITGTNSAKSPGSLTRLWLGNLHQTITNVDLRESFSTFGTIVDSGIRKNTAGYSIGSGWVEYEDPASAANAIEKLNGLVIRNLPMIVCASSEQATNHKPPASSNPPGAFRSVFVKNYPINWQESHIFDLIHRFGMIPLGTYDVTMPRRIDNVAKGHAFVNFDDYASARTAVQNLNGRKIEGQTLYVSRCLSKDELAVSGERQGISKNFRFPATNLYVRNFPLSWGETELAAPFHHFGQVTGVKVMVNPGGQSKGFGFVSLATAEIAEMAVSHLHMRFVCPDGKRLYVRLHEKKENRMKRLGEEFRKRNKGGTGSFNRGSRRSSATPTSQTQAPPNYQPPTNVQSLSTIPYYGSGGANRADRRDDGIIQPQIPPQAQPQLINPVIQQSAIQPPPMTQQTSTPTIPTPMHQLPPDMAHQIPGLVSHPPNVEHHQLGIPSNTYVGQQQLSSQMPMMQIHPQARVQAENQVYQTQPAQLPPRGVQIPIDISLPHLPAVPGGARSVQTQPKANPKLSYPQHGLPTQPMQNTIQAKKRLLPPPSKNVPPSNITIDGGAPNRPIEMIQAQPLVPVQAHSTCNQIEELEEELPSLEGAIPNLDRLKTGDILVGEVLYSLVNVGSFLHVGFKFEGILHLQEMPQSLRKNLKKGRRLWVMVKLIEMEKKCLHLTAYLPGCKVSGKVAKIAKTISATSEEIPFGVFVDIGWVSAVLLHKNHMENSSSAWQLNQILEKIWVLKNLDANVPQTPRTTSQSQGTKSQRRINLIEYAPLRWSRFDVDKWLECFVNPECPFEVNWMKKITQKSVGLVGSVVFGPSGWAALKNKLPRERNAKNLNGTPRDLLNRIRNGLLAVRTFDKVVIKDPPTRRNVSRVRRSIPPKTIQAPTGLKPTKPPWRARQEQPPPAVPRTGNRSNRKGKPTASGRARTPLPVRQSIPQQRLPSKTMPRELPSTCLRLDNWPGGAAELKQFLTEKTGRPLLSVQAWPSKELMKSWFCVFKTKVDAALAMKIVHGFQLSTGSSIKLVPLKPKKPQN